MSTMGVDLALDVKFLRQRARETGGPEDPLPAVAQGLADCTGLEAETLLKRLRERENGRYVVIARAETFSLGDGESKVREWMRNGIPGVDGEPWGPVPGIILDQRPFRRTTEGSSAAALVGATHAIAFAPPAEEYDELPCRVVIDVPGFLEWCAEAEIPVDGDPLLELSRALAATLGAGIDPKDVHDRLAIGSETKVVLVEPRYLRSGLVKRLRSISLGDRTIPRRYLMEFTDPVMLADLEHRYPKLKGASGVEARFDPELSPIHGHFSRQVAPGNQTYSSEKSDLEPPRDGLEVRLSIDLDLQNFATTRLQEAIDAHHAVGGWVVVADPRSGEILAAVDILHNDRARARAESVPAGPETEEVLRKLLSPEDRRSLELASPGLRTTAWPPESLDPARDSDGLGPAYQRSRIWNDVFAPGSTFKSFFWAWATEHGGIEPDDVLDTPGPRGSEAWKRFSHRNDRGRVVSRNIRDGHAFPRATWETALVKSLNTGMAQVAHERISPQRMEEMLVRFQFRFPSGINMGSEGTTMAWKPGDAQYSYIWTHLSLSFGHEISCTPIQLVRAFCAFARPDGGVPLLTLRRRADDGSGGIIAPRAISPETVVHTKRALEKVVESGTGQFGVKSDRYRIFGKSGTAQMIKFVEAAVRTEGDPSAPEGESYEWRKIGSLGPYSTADEKRFLPSFIGAAPFEEPRIVVACGLQDPDIERGDNLLRGGQAYGGGFSAGRVVKDVVEFALEQMGVESDRPRDPSEPIASAR